MAARATLKRCRPSSFLSTLSRHPSSSPAITSNGTTLSYGDLARAVSSLLPHFVSRIPFCASSSETFPPRVAFLTPATAVYVQSLLATWNAGATAVPLSPLYPPNALGDLVNDSEPSLLVTACPYGHAVTSSEGSWSSNPEMALLPLDANGAVSPDAPCRNSSIGAGEANVRSLSGSTTEIVGDLPAMLLYTSGTTGVPKGVVWTHSMVDYQVSMLAREWRWTPNDHVLNTLPLHHVHGIVNILLTALYAGARCTMLDRFDVDTVWASFCAPVSESPTVFMAVPTIYQRLIRRYETANSREQQKWRAATARMRLFVCGSAALPKADFDAWQRISGHSILERYGMTETGMLLSNPYDARMCASLGVPLPGVDVKVVPPESQGTKVDEHERKGTVQGELFVRGPGVFSRYWGREVETKDAFDEDGYFKTGDVVAMDAESKRFRMLGRASTDIVKTGGFKVSALEVEQVLTDCPLVRTGSVFGVDDGDLGQRLACAVVLEDGTCASADTPVMDDAAQRATLLSWFSAHLPRYKVPRSIFFVQDIDIPRNALGKVQKKELSRIYANADADGYPAKCM